MFKTSLGYQQGKAASCPGDAQILLETTELEYQLLQVLHQVSIF